VSSRVYRPLAALVLILLFAGLFVWFTKGRGGDVPLRGFALIRAHCAEMTAEAQRQVGASDSGIIRFAVKRQCATSPTAYAKEFRAFSRCVEKQLGYWKGFLPSSSRELRPKIDVGIPASPARGTFGTTCSRGGCTRRPTVGQSRFVPLRSASPAPLTRPHGPPAIGGLEALSGETEGLLILNH
jgi:hypothetical protein